MTDGIRGPIGPKGPTAPRGPDGIRATDEQWAACVEAMMKVFYEPGGLLGPPRRRWWHWRRE